MAVWLVSIALATEPIVVVGTSSPDGPGQVRSEVVLDWSDVGFRPAGPEATAVGPDLLAVGPDGAAALYDPLGKRIIVVGGAAFGVPAADGLAFAGPGVLLVLDDRARRLRTYRADGTPLDEAALPGVVPPGGALRVEGELATSVDAFGNGHPLATIGEEGTLTRPVGPALVPAARAVVRDGADIRVDGRTVATVEGRGGARLLGGWLLVEAMDRGAVTRRAIPLTGGDAVELPVRGRLYAPSQDVAVASDGDLAWIDPRVDGLWLVRVAP